MRRLGLDIGTNSIGWCLVEYDNEGQIGTSIVDIGARIFSNGRDPKTGASLAVDRRAARAMRRRRDRYIGRRSAFLDTLVRYGLMPADSDEAKLLADRDPYELRARALTDRLEPYEIGRALFHLNQRRGFKSNRKAERRAKDNEDGKITSGARALDQAMAEDGADTLGQFLAGRDEKRVRLNGESQGYDFYPQRRHIEYEFGRIWEEQAKHHPALLTDEARAALHRVLFYQRPLKEPKVGLCLFAGRYGIPRDEPRLPKAHPLFQRRRLHEEVNQLEITAPGEAPRKLTRDQRDALILELRGKKERGFDALAKRLKLQPGESFNKASETRTKLAGDEVYAALADKKRLGDRWPHFSSERQWEIVKRLLDEEDPEALHAFLTGECGLDEEAAQATAKVSLPEGYGRLGETATRRILEQLEADVVTYSEAVERCGWHHSDDRTGEILDRLPYYGELLSRDIPPGSFDPADEGAPEKYWGKITNPTVHIGLRQLEKLVNAIIAVHGKPDQIVVELARELIAVTLPIEGHHLQNARFRAQWEASKPLCKQLWRRIVSAKIVMQGSLLAARGIAGAEAFPVIARRVKSGDSDNAEAQAARRYWPLLMGSEFRRDRDSPGANALLNYGYAIMRATVARAVVAAGLHPTIGINHANRGNALALADDLVEPFRPLVDALVVAMMAAGVEALDPALKRRFARLIAFDVTVGGEASPVSIAAARLAQALARAFETGRPTLALFDPPTPIEWAALARANDSADPAAA